MTGLISFLRKSGKSRKFCSYLNLFISASNYQITILFSHLLIFFSLSMLSLLPSQHSLQNFFSQTTTNLQNKLDLESSSTLLLSQVFNDTFSKALSSPLFDASVIYAVLFGTYNLGKRIQGINPNDSRISVNQAIFAGGCSGLAVSGFLAPMDLAKGRLAIDKSVKKTSPLSILRRTRRIANTHGLKTAFQGNLTKAMRETRSGATYFGCYEYVSKKLHSAYGNQNFIPFIAGGTAGFISWLASYPPSLIKAYRQFEECTKNNYLQNRIMLRGFGVFSSATKAVLIEAVTYLLYPNANKPKY